MKYFLLLIFFVIGKECSAQSVSLNGKSEYIAIFGDIQYLTNDLYSSIYRSSLDWILKNYNNGISFKCVLHTGDITQNNIVSQWEHFYEETRQLASVIPYFSMIGDHDYTWLYPGTQGLIYDRQSTFLNEYVQFPLSTGKVVEWFEYGHMENVVVENTVHGQRLDLLILEFGPREEVVTWADAYVKSHPDHRFILMTHEYLEQGGGRRNKNLKMELRLQNTTYTTPDEIWNKLVKCNDNICIVLCGHVGGLYAVTVEENDFGHKVSQIQHNIQGSEYRYDNWLMLWEFPIDSEYAKVSIINTKTLNFNNNEEVLFTFKYREISESPVPFEDVISVVKLIDIIGVVEYTADCKFRIDAARAAYDALTDAQKSLVTNYSMLIAAESEYNRLMEIAAGIITIELDKTYTWYNLYGNRQQKQPSRKGIYIVNKKRVFIR